MTLNVPNFGSDEERYALDEVPRTIPLLGFVRLGYQRPHVELSRAVRGTFDRLPFGGSAQSDDAYTVPGTGQQ